MASIQDKIAAAKAQGISDDEIWNYLQDNPQVQQAIKATSLADTQDYFGLKPTPQNDSVAREPLIAASGVAKGLAQGIGLPGTAIELGNKFLPDWMTRSLFSIDDKGFHLFPTDESGKPVPGSTMGLPDVEDTTGFTKNLGLTDRPELTPQNGGEKYLRAASEGIGSAIPFALSGMSPLALGTSGVTSGVGAEAGNELMPGNPWASIAGGFMGGLSAQTLTEAGERAATRVGLTKAAEAAQQALADFRAGDVTDKITQDTALRAAKTNATSTFDQIKADATATHDVAAGAAQATIDATVKSIAPSTTWQQAGEVLRSKAKDWLNVTLPAKLSDVWAPVDKAIDPKTPVDLNNFGAALDSINKAAGSLEPLNALLKPGMPKQLKNAFDSITKGQEVGMPAPTWSDLQTIRTTLGDAMRDPKIMPSVGDQNLKFLYSAITGDMKSVAQKAGALDAFNTANAESSRLFGIAEGPIAKSLDDGKSPEAVAKTLLSGAKAGGTDLTVLRNEIPDAVDHLASAHLGTDSWANLSPEGKVALVPDAGKRATLDAASAQQGAARDSLGTTLSSAKQKAAADIADAHAAYRQWNQSRAVNRNNLTQRALAAASAAKAAPAAFDFSAPTLGGAIKGAITGGPIGGMLLNSLGFGTDTLLNSEIGAAIGIGVPALMKGIGAVVRDPSLLAGPLIGVSAGNKLQGQ